MYQNLNFKNLHHFGMIKSTLRTLSAHVEVLGIKTKHLSKITQICLICQIRFAKTRMAGLRHSRWPSWSPNMGDQVYDSWDITFGTTPTFFTERGTVKVCSDWLV